MSEIKDITNDTKTSNAVATGGTNDKKEKAKNDAQAGSEQPQKSKAQLRAERREIQEKQRATKDAKKSESGGAKAQQQKEPKQQQQPKADSKQQQAKPDSKQQQAKPAQQQASQQQKPQSALTSEVPSQHVLKSALKGSKENLMPKQHERASSNDSMIVNAPSESGMSSVHGSSATLASRGTTSTLSREFSQAPDVLQLNKKNARKDKDADKDSGKKFKLFNHLKYVRDFSILEKLSLESPAIHPAFIKLGLQYAKGTISGSNSRCLAFLAAFKQFTFDYKRAKEPELVSKDLEAKLKPNINFLTQCRPLSVSMANAIKELKQKILQLPTDTTESEIKKMLYEEIDKFAEEKIKLADQTICKYMLAHEDVVISGTTYSKSKLTNDDCVLIYGCSSLVIHVLKAAHKKFPNMKVIIVDSRPKLSGRTALYELSKTGIDCTYVLINAVSYVMNRVTKVIIGAHALLANGYVMASVGASQVALVAKWFNVPLVVCCETYKFCDKVQTDVFVNNELGDPSELLAQSSCYRSNESPLKNWSMDTEPNINLVNLIYDVTPPDLISCVVTEMGMLPCTSVPVVLRLKNRDNYIGGSCHGAKSTAGKQKVDIELAY